MIQTKIDKIKPRIKNALITISHTTIAGVECLFVEKRGYGFGTGVIVDILGELYFSEEWGIEPADIPDGRVLSFSQDALLPFETYCKRIGV
jgi:hypothetical protein